MLDNLEIALLNWRIFSQTKVTLPQESFLLTGPNGSGKTSLLAAFYSLLTGTSFSGKLIQYLRQDCQYFGLTTNYDDWFLTGKIGSTGRLQTSYEHPKIWPGQNLSYVKKLEITQKPEHNQSSEQNNLNSKLTAWPAVLTYIPSDNTWFELSRGDKLAKLDQLLSQIYGTNYQLALTKFNKALKAKQKFLNNCLEQKTTGDLFLVHNLSQEVYQSSITLWQFRLNFWQELDQILEEFSLWLATSVKQMSIKYQVNNFHGVRQVVEITSQISPKTTNWQGLWSKETIVGQVLFGAHRDDFEILVNSVPIQNYFSRGEMRLFVLFIKNLAASIIGRKSQVIGLFDDVFGELDLEREQILLGQLLEKTNYFVATSAQKIPHFAQTFELNQLQKK